MNTGHAALCSSPEWAEFIAGEVLPAVLARVDPGDDVLEIGPGYGATTERLIGLGRQLTAVEIEPALAAELRERFPSVRVVDGRGESLPFPASSFTAVFCFTMLHHMHSAEAQDALFRQARRVLRPGGVFAGSDSIASDDLRGFHEGDIYTPVDPATLADRLSTVGFTDVKIQVASTWFAFSGSVPGDHTAMTEPC